MALHNSEIAAILNETADALELEGENPFRVRAYRNAARVISSWPNEISEMLEDGRALSELPGIGKDLAGKIGEIATTGRFRLLDEITKKLPAGWLALLQVPGLGPKKVRALCTQLAVTSLDDLRAVALAGKIRKLAGFGERSEQKILEEVAKVEARPHRVKLMVADEASRAVIARLKKVPGVEQAITAGSYRRRQETVGDLDVLVTCRQRSAPQVMNAFVTYDEVDRVLSKGGTRATVIFRSGIQVDLRVVPNESYGAALMYFTGSKAHNIALRTIGVKRGLKINEYGVFRGKKSVAGRTEKEIYELLGLAYIEPELRENRGEIEAARSGALPRLLRRQDLRGDLHAHTTITDGRNSLEEMAQAAAGLGYEYLAITEHTISTRIARGLDARSLRKHLRSIDALNGRLTGFRILKSAEVDILEDGRLDLPDSVLQELDLAICSIHSRFNLSRQKQTERVLRAMDNPNFTILGHPTGRLINSREPYDIDVETLIRAAGERGCFLELNAQPDRLDLADMYCRLCKSLGVKVAISTDAHSTSDLRFMEFGVAQARRGWLEKADVLNSLSLDALLTAIGRRKPARRYAA